jgi:aminopeptidase N
MLEEWKRDLLHPDGGKGAAAGPLTLGLRLVTTSSSEDYQRVVYGKGAWVLHMLRMLLRDYKTGSDERFLIAMRDFVATHLWQNVTTADFRRTMEKHAGEDLGWFFDTWVEGTTVPRYAYAWRAVERGGAHKVELRVRQTNTPPVKMIVPVKLELGAAGAAVVRIVVDQAEKVYELDPPAVVTGLELNPFDAVLCEVTREKLE